MLTVTPDLIVNVEDPSCPDSGPSGMSCASGFSCRHQNHKEGSTWLVLSGVWSACASKRAANCACSAWPRDGSRCPVFPHRIHQRAHKWVIDVPNQSMSNAEVPVILYHPTEKKLWLALIHLWPVPMIIDTRLCHTLHVKQIYWLEKDSEQNLHILCFGNQIFLCMLDRTQGQSRK